MNNLKFKLPKSTSVPTFSEPFAEGPKIKKDHLPYKHQRPHQQQHQPQHNHPQRPLQNQNQYQNQHNRQPLQQFHQNIPLDYHLRLPSVIDNPKKMPKFDYIRVIPAGTSYAVYLQNNNLSFCSATSSVPVFQISHKNPINRTLFIATMVKTGFFVITDVLIYCGRFLSTNEERISALVDIFSRGLLADINSPNIESPVLDISFNSTHLFSQWTDFARGSLHIPYEIKHLEYCFYKGDLVRQTHRYVYILNKKNLKKSPHVSELVITNSRDFRVDINPEDSSIIVPQDFKTCILNGTPYTNILGFSHLDKQEESECESDEE